jgi:Protein of unknown function (DUF4058)
MPSPFIGMDPYLEEPQHWATFQNHFVSSLYQVLLPGLVDRYRARVGVRNYTVEFPLFTSVIREPHEEQYIEIRERTDGRIVTLINIVSPTNKTTQVGREAYLATRKLIESQRASAVEIDLITHGLPMLDLSRDSLPEHDYTVIVNRSMAPSKYEIYAVTVQKRLPKFKLPLALDDRDAMLDLQDVFRRAYDTANFAKTVDYRKELPGEVKLSDVNLAWVDLTLKQSKYR